MDIEKIREHYEHAKRKHPYFCDEMLPQWNPSAIERQISDNLGRARRRIKSGAAGHDLMWNEVLDCEVWEVSEALYDADKERAAEECYDAIAVLLRVVDVLEGRQPLGNPEAKGDLK